MIATTVAPCTQSRAKSFRRSLQGVTICHGTRERHKGETLLPNLMVSLAAEHVAAHVLEPPDGGRFARPFTLAAFPTG